MAGLGTPADEDLSEAAPVLTVAMARHHGGSTTAGGGSGVDGKEYDSPVSTGFTHQAGLDSKCR